MTASRKLNADAQNEDILRHTDAAQQTRKPWGTPAVKPIHIPDQTLAGVDDDPDGGGLS